MGVIFMPNRLIWKMLQWAHIISLLMYFHNGNLYFVVVMNVHISIILTKKKTKFINKQHSLLGFTFIKLLDVVLPMVEFH